MDVVLKDSKIEVTLRSEMGYAIVSMREPLLPNLVDSDDGGRLIQASEYGGADGSVWNNVSWQINPIQGTDWSGKFRSKILAAVKDSPTKHRCSVQGVHWATGVLLPFVFDQSIEIVNGVVIRKQTSRTVSGWSNVGSARHQESPAVYTRAPYVYLRTGGKAPQLLADRNITNVNVYGNVGNGWLGLTNSKGYGLYFTSSMSEYTAFSVSGLHSCGYVAPIETKQIYPGYSRSFENRFTVGMQTAAMVRLKVF